MAPWGRLGASWGRLGASWGRLGAILGRLGAVLLSSWGVSVPTSSILKEFRTILGPKIVPKMFQKRIPKLIVSVTPVLNGFGHQNGAKNDPKVYQISNPVTSRLRVVARSILHAFSNR